MLLYNIDYNINYVKYIEEKCYIRNYELYFTIILDPETRIIYNTLRCIKITEHLVFHNWIIITEAEYNNLEIWIEELTLKYYLRIKGFYLILDYKIYYLHKLLTSESLIPLIFIWIIHFELIL